MHRIILQGRGLTAAFVQQAAQIAGAAQLEWRSAEIVHLSGFGAPPPRDALLDHCEQGRADCAFIAQPLRLADYRLAVMDMDSTLITIECIDEIADMQGLKPQVSAITEAAMRGELDFRASLTRRVALLEGLEVGALERVYAERLRLSPGAEALLRGLKSAGLKTLLVSGGFTFFTDRLRPRLDIDYSASNTLEIENGRLTGKVLGAIIDAEAKAQQLRAACAALGCATEQAIAIGDGANDLKMMAAAGLSVAYRAKPVVRAQARFSISHNGLDALRNLFE